MAVDLSNWTRTKIPYTIDSRPGHVVTAEEWNEMFNSLINQGNHSEDTLEALIEAYGSMVTQEYATKAEHDTLKYKVEGLAIAAISAFNHNEVSGRDVADAHSIPSITGLEPMLTAMNKRMTGIEANILSALLHALDTPNVAAPVVQSILNLEGRLTAIENRLTALENNKQDKLNFAPAEGIPANAPEGSVWLKHV